jgi:hypothetical protein
MVWLLSALSLKPNRGGFIFFFFGKGEEEKIYHRPKTLQSPVKHTSFAVPHKPSFGYYAQYGDTSAGRTAKVSTTVSTNFISSNMVNDANKH